MSEREWMVECGRLAEENERLRDWSNYHVFAGKMCYLTQNADGTWSGMLNDYGHAVPFRIDACDEDAAHEYVRKLIEQRKRKNHERA